MSLKSLELQVAIPKTFDAGKIAEQLHQQNAISQANAQAASARQLEKNRETVTKSNEMESDLGESSRQKQEQEKKKRPNNVQSLNETKHPFKGNFVDFSG